jgi:hypothetical protein
MAAAKEKVPANIDKVLIDTSDAEATHSEVEPEGELHMLKAATVKSTHKGDWTGDSPHGASYDHGPSASASTKLGAKQKTPKVTYSPETSEPAFTMATPSAPSSGMGPSMMPLLTHHRKPMASLSISDTTFTLKSFSGAVKQRTAQKDG